MMFQNVLNVIIKMQGISVTLKDISTGNSYTHRAAISNYFRSPAVEEEIESTGRQYVISTNGLEFTPKRGDGFIISDNQYFSISNVHELVAFGNIIGYRLVLK